MASTSKDAPSPATCQSHFEQGVAYALHLWPDLTLAVQNNWGGPDSSDKRDWFAGAVVDLFPDLTKPKPSTTPSASTSSTAEESSGAAVEEPDSAYVEEFLLQVMLDEFEVNVDDDSSFEVAEQILRVRGECLKGKFDGEVEQLRRRWDGLKGKKVEFKKGEDEEGETDWDSESEDDEEDGEDVEMGEAPALVSKEKEEPVVDEEGFTMVTKKKR
ncbi:Pre-rRNA-processing protein TSR2-domain-containing protein [Coniochaeta sp. 2T2.1]|nr:Pre-rRNA-processing protein TSR2-domain-containing protein [Coniochaeta sp. 2T2.1]